MTNMQPHFVFVNVQVVLACACSGVVTSQLQCVVRKLLFCFFYLRCSCTHVRPRFLVCTSRRAGTSSTTYANRRSRDATRRRLSWLHVANAVTPATWGDEAAAKWVRGVDYCGTA